MTDLDEEMYNAVSHLVAQHQATCNACDVDALEAYGEMLTVLADKVKSTRALPPPCGRCGAAHCSSECKAVVHHGPGHQSTTHCQEKGAHEQHWAMYGEFNSEISWSGDEVFD